MAKRSLKAKPQGDADAYVERVIGRSPNALIPHYLMACYAYYVLDDPIISDRLFDVITKRLIAEWDTLEHMHKHLITMDDLVAGTGFALKYPTIVKFASADMARRLHEGILM